MAKYFGDARDKENYKGNTSTMPPRQRQGKIYAGGRGLRRAMRRLMVAQSPVSLGKKSEHGHNEPGGSGTTLAGAMNP